MVSVPVMTSPEGGAGVIHLAVEGLGDAGQPVDLIWNDAAGHRFAFPSLAGRITLRLARSDSLTRRTKARISVSTSNLYL